MPESSIHAKDMKAALEKEVLRGGEERPGKVKQEFARDLTGP